MTTIQKAGAIILNQKDPALVALLYRSKQDDWSFPKGHVEENESVIATMRREVAEETGLLVHLVDNELLPMEYIHPKGDHVIVSMFIVQSDNDVIPKIKLKGDKIIWVPYKEVADKLSYDNVKQYYHKILRRVEDVIKELQSKIY